MSKIIQAINSMIENSDKIISVIKKGNEIFFNYRGHIMSIIEHSEGNSYRLYIYPKSSTTSELVSIMEHRDYCVYVLYDTEKIRGREALESFNNLYVIVAEKVYDINKILDDIIEEN